MAQTRKQLATGQCRTLASIQKRLMAMAAEWGEVDNGTMWELQRLADMFEAVAKDMKGAA